MQSVRLYAKGDLRVEQIADPKPPAENEVTLAVTVAGICGSDGSPPIFDGVHL